MEVVPRTDQSTGNSDVETLFPVLFAYRGGPRFRIMNQARIPFSLYRNRLKTRVLV